MAVNQSWVQVLHERGVQIENGRATAHRRRAGEMRSADTVALVPLLSDSILAVDGADAAEFLQGQLTNDIGLISAARAQPTAYCTAKGRVLATLLLWQAGSTLFMQLPNELTEPVRKRLQMYVLRSQVALSEASERKALLGLAGSLAAEVAREHLRLSLSAPYDCASNGAITAIALPGDRVILAVDTDAAPRTWDELAQVCEPSGEAVWASHAIAAGVPVVTTTTTDSFIPQMLNLELLGAVSFQKGCYTGQEIVARTEHLGQVKRRLFRFRCGELPGPGDDVFVDATQVGTVVNAAPLPAGGSELLAVVPTASAQAHLFALSPHGVALHALPLPYLIPDVSVELTGDAR